MTTASTAGQLGERQRRREEALRAEEGERRRALAPHRIDEHAPPVDLEQQRGVAEPRDAQAARRRRAIVRGGAPLDRQRRVGGPKRRAAEHELAHRPPRGPVDTRQRVHELPAAPLRRARGPREPRPLHAPAQRLARREPEHAGTDAGERDDGEHAPEQHAQPPASAARRARVGTGATAVARRVRGRHARAPRGLVIAMLSDLECAGSTSARTRPARRPSRPPG